jgi:hypothetical protein
LWAHHSLEQVARELVDLDIERPSRTEQIALRLNK